MRWPGGQQGIAEQGAGRSKEGGMKSGYRLGELSRGRKQWHLVHSFSFVGAAAPVVHASAALVHRCGHGSLLLLSAGRLLRLLLLAGNPLVVLVDLEEAADLHSQPKCQGRRLQHTTHFPQATRTQTATGEAKQMSGRGCPNGS